MKRYGFPEKQGLYDPAYERDSCGVGFVAHIKGASSHEIVSCGLTVLRNLSHRGAQGADPKTGDGAGILVQVPDLFLRGAVRGFDLPKAGDYAVGMVFLPPSEPGRDTCVSIFEKRAQEAGLSVLGWRDVPVDSRTIGETAQSVEPVVRQVFLACPAAAGTAAAFEVALYLLRRVVEKEVLASDLPDKKAFYILSLSARTLVYKGLLMSEQLEEFYPDLSEPLFSSALALVHSRYSTNTFPTWDLAQPFRYLAHNGEINTLRGNMNWMTARRASLASPMFGEDIQKIFPVLVAGGSDSAILDNMVEFLLLSGRPLAHVMMMLIPEAWEKDASLDEAARGFYEYHSALVEPWDGPAAVAFTDGASIGAILDRNGLRPARYTVTKNDLVVMASETGVVPIDPKDIVRKGRLQPGKMLVIDTVAQKLLLNDEVKEQVFRSRPYAAWARKNMVPLETLPPRATAPVIPAADLVKLQLAFGTTREDLKVVLIPMAETGYEPTGSMGADTPLAVLSNHPQPLYNYFKQLFAQVTNPPIDPIREEVVMSLSGFLGRQRNICSETEEHCGLIRTRQPILLNEELERLRGIEKPGYKARTLSLLLDLKTETLQGALGRLCKEASACIRDGVNLILLSDRGVDERSAAIPALLACSAVHHHLVRETTRMQASLILETADAREVHHFALLLGYGANAINPYLAYETLRGLQREGEGLSGLDPRKAIANYIKAIDRGLLKIFSKMGISTLQSYSGAQIFEALGLGSEVVERYFTGTVSRIGGADLGILEKEVRLRHAAAFPERPASAPVLPVGGWYQYRQDGEVHMWNPETITAVQEAVRNEDYGRFKDFTRLIDDQKGRLVTLRSLFKLKPFGPPIPVDQVEPASQILRRFVTGAMSFGSISKEAHEAIAVAMNRLGGMSNSGEGGEDPERSVPLPNGDSRRSRIKQVASGRFGVNGSYLAHADELQIKIAQGAKPGEGGQLPGHKVDAIVAKIRHSTPGVMLISPPPHHDIYSIEDLAQLIYDLKNANPRARVSVKLVSEIGVGTIAAGVAKGHAEMILISGYDGGTGASPVSSIKHAGLPWELGLSEAHQVLVMNDLRGRVRLQTDGQLRTAKDIVVAAMLGAEEYGFATTALVVLGCVMLRHCHLNTCSVGVATQEPELRKRFRGASENLVTYFSFLAREVQETLSALGCRSLNDLIGRSDLLEVDDALRSWKAGDLDLKNVLFRPLVGEAVARRSVQKQDFGLDKAMDLTLIEMCRPALDEKKPVALNLEIRNVHRTVGAMLSGEISRRYGEAGLPPETIRLNFKGTAGQSFAAFGARGVTFRLEGDANDYLGKGLSGARVIVVPPPEAPFAAEENIIVGNVLLYGATEGEVFIRGIAGERFAVRNSGVTAVVEGVGDHGCEYMTGGQVVVIGPTGRNFAAGMSGGIAYVYDRDKNFASRCNNGMVKLGPLLEREDVAFVRGVLEKHVHLTGSVVAGALLKDWAGTLMRFVRVMPWEYKRVLEKRTAQVPVEVGSEVSDG